MRTDPPEASCDGKEPYRSAHLAHKVSRRRQSKGSGRKLTVYRCRYCGLWHHGTARREAKS